MKDHVLKTYAMTLEQAGKLVADVPCERFAEVPYAYAKHPAWVLGHLSLASGMGAAHIEKPELVEPGISDVPAAWAETSMGEPSSDRSKFATKDELLAELSRVHSVFADRFTNAGDDVIAREFPNPDWRSFFPTIGDAVFYLMTHHEGYHLGQLTQWRRAAGFDAAPEG